MKDYKQMLDTELLTLLKGQDPLAFAEIYDRYAILVYHKVYQMLRDEEVSKDLVQDLFSTVWIQANNIQEGANLAGYLYVASRNRVLRFIQKGKTKSDYLTELGKYAERASFETLEKLDEKELMLLIVDEIAKLPPKMQQIFQLSRLEDLSHREIAIQLGISEATVRKQVQYALRILRSKLSNYSVYGILLLAFFRNQ